MVGGGVGQVLPSYQNRQISALDETADAPQSSIFSLLFSLSSLLSSHSLSLSLLSLFSLSPLSLLSLLCLLCLLSLHSPLSSLSPSLPSPVLSLLFHLPFSLFLCLLKKTAGKHAYGFRHTSVCAFKTSPCVPATRPHEKTHVAHFPQKKRCPDGSFGVVTSEIPRCEECPASAPLTFESYEIELRAFWHLAGSSRVSPLAPVARVTTCFPAHQASDFLASPHGTTAQTVPSTKIKKEIHRSGVSNV